MARVLVTGAAGMLGSELLAQAPPGTECVATDLSPGVQAGGVDLADAGALFAGDLAGPKARVLLQLALGSGLDAASALEAEAG